MVALATQETQLNNRQWAALERARKRWHLPEAAFDILVNQILTADYEEQEVLICAADYQYFLTEWCFIYDAQAATWIPFELWPEQIDVLNTIHDNQLTIILKARQLGLTWLCLGYILWSVLFRPIATVMLYSRRDDEAMALLSDERLRGMLMRLPEWMRSLIVVDNAHQLKLSNDSIIYAFPTTAGDSYTSTIVMIDEADLVPDLNKLMRSVKPTIDAGGKMVLISRVDKSKPGSEFKKIYTAAKEGKNDWAFVFLPWHVHPGRTQHWYNSLRQDVFARTGAEDELKEQYPATDTEALAPRSLDKRIPPHWVEVCYVKTQPLNRDDHRDIPDLPNLCVYKKPVALETYVVGIDPAEGNPTSDDSAMTIMNSKSLEEVASLRGKIEPSVMAAYAKRLADWYNHAPVMVERQNHGHAVILWLRDHSTLTILTGHENSDDRLGWNSSSLGKVLMYDAGADAFRDQTCTVHTLETMTQIQSIEGGTLRAPEGFHDDLSDSFMLCIVGAPKAVSVDWNQTEVV